MPLKNRVCKRAGLNMHGKWTEVTISNNVGAAYSSGTDYTPGGPRPPLEAATEHSSFSFASDIRSIKSVHCAHKL